MRNDLTELVFVIDRSGSTRNIYSTSVDGFREFINGQLATPGNINLSVYTFDSYTEAKLERANLRKYGVAEAARKNIPQWIEPRGMTALYDAMSEAIDKTGAALAALPEAKRPSKVIVITITDGLENCSRVPAALLRDKIRHQQDTYSWDFVFLGANQDAILSAQVIGINAGATMDYSATEKGTRSLYQTLSNRVAGHRLATRDALAVGAAAPAYAFSPEDREAVIDKADPTTP